MVLQSQLIRTDRVRRFATTRRRRRRPAARWAVVAVAAAGLTWWLWPGDDPDAAPHGPGAPSLAATDANDKGGDTGRKLASDTVVVPPVRTDANAAEATVERRRREQAGFLAQLRDAAPHRVRLPQQPQAADDAPDGAPGPPPPAPAPVFVTPGPAGAEAPEASRKSEAAAAEPAVTQLIPGLAAELSAQTFTSASATGDRIRQGMTLIEKGRFVEGRRVLSDVLAAAEAGLTARDAQTIRDTLASVNQSLIFSKRIIEGDPLVEAYTVQPGDLLGKIGRRYAVTYQLLERINGIDANRIQVGQRIKAIKGPFHAVVSKSAYRMDVYLNDADGAAAYIRSFRVGLGKGDGTPEGRFTCKRGGKLINPSWRHPQTNEFFAADDPKNPIGEHWIALEGADARTKGLSGYGIHGTIEKESIGRQMSLGCVRMLAEDVELVYYLLAEGQSTVTIQP